MQYFARKLGLLPVVLLLVNCGGSSSESGAASAGTTTFTGEWSLVAALNVNVGGTETSVTDTSRVEVDADGNVVVIETDTACSLNIVVDDNTMTYESTCTFTVTNNDISSPCVLTFRIEAVIRGDPGSASLSGPFGPETLACRGVAVSFTGNLVGQQTDD